jgi:hypothetical protein
MIPLCSRFDSVLFTPKMSAIACHGNYSRSPSNSFCMAIRSDMLHYHRMTQSMKNSSLIARNFAGIAECTSRLTNLRAPISLVYSYVIGLCFVYALVRVHIPIMVYPGLPHDDGLFMTLGRSLAEGKWLGRFSQFTLMKGPGYPAFLAINNWLGIPLSLGHALFHCFAITLFVAVCHRFIKSHLISGVFFALLLWHPISLSGEILRVFREEIYYAQTLLVLGLMLWVLFCTIHSQPRHRYAAFAGAILGWFWLTREEGVWIVPALGLMALVAVLRIFRNRWDMLRYPRAAFKDPRLRGLAVALAIAIGVFAATQTAFSSVNWFVYGKFVGVDFKEENFQRALRAIDSVRSGGTKPFVSITHAAMKRVDAVSPAFASLAPYFGKGWETWGCQFYPSACGEFGSGWFMWALRDAASSTGHYSSPREASEFFGRLADEISAACKGGKLECKPQLIAEMPPIRWPDIIRRMLPRYVDAFHLLILRNPPMHLNISHGSENALARALRFLNYPLHMSSAEIPTIDSYTLSGWYYAPKGAWITAEIRTPTGAVVSSRLERLGSPDIAQHFKDPDASNQRFSLFTRCSDACALILRTPEGVTIQKIFAELRKTPIVFNLDNGQFYIDKTDFQPDPEYTPTLFDRLCGDIRKAVMVSYSWIFLPILAIGLIAFLASILVFWRKAMWNVCFVMALVCWGLAFERTTLLILIASSSFPALLHSYLAPAYFMLVSGAVLSIAALLQLFQPGQQALTDVTAGREIA